MRLFTVIVSFNRPQELLRTVRSYQATVDADHWLSIVDNGSTDPMTMELLDHFDREIPVWRLGKNLYPGYATNFGFDKAPPYATHLHRSDSDMEYLSGWCDWVRHAFGHTGVVGQVGLRTSLEENDNYLNVGGTAVFDRKLWDEGLRYRTDSWETLGTFTEDYWISQEVVERGYRWVRVKRPCVVHLATGDLNDPYYQHSYGVRGLLAESDS